MSDINKIIMDELDKERKINKMYQDNTNRREIKATLAFHGLTFNDLIKHLGITRQGFYYRLDTHPEDAIVEFRNTIKEMLNSKE